MLSNAYFLAKFRFDTAENEPAKNLQNFRKMHFSKIRSRLFASGAQDKVVHLWGFDGELLGSCKGHRRGNELKDRSDPKSGLASPQHTTSIIVLILLILSPTSPDYSSVLLYSTVKLAPRQYSYWTSDLPGQTGRQTSAGEMPAEQGDRKQGQADIPIGHNRRTWSSFIV